MICVTVLRDDLDGFGGSSIVSLRLLLLLLLLDPESALRRLIKAGLLKPVKKIKWSRRGNDEHADTDPPPLRPAPWIALKYDDAICYIYLTSGKKRIGSSCSCYI